MRRLSRNVLAIGTVVAVLAACGPLWVVRSGVVVALAAAVVSCLAAWREVASLRRSHAAEMLVAARAHGAALGEERRNNALVVDTLSGRARRAADRAGVAEEAIEHHRASLTDLQAKLSTVQQDRVELRRENTFLREDLLSWQHDVSSLHQDRDALQDEVRRDQLLISSLEETVLAREAELTALRDEDTTQLRAIPRRIRAVEPASETRPADVELRPEDTGGVLDLSMLKTAVALPNYEEDRKLA